MYILVHINKIIINKRKPADVVGLARGLQFQTVGSQFFFVGADRDDGLPPSLRTGRLIIGWARAEQHAIAVFRRNLGEIGIKMCVHSRFFFFTFKFRDECI